MRPCGKRREEVFQIEPQQNRAVEPEVTALETSAAVDMAVDMIVRRPESNTALVGRSIWAAAAFQAADRLKAGPWAGLPASHKRRGLQTAGCVIAPAAPILAYRRGHPSHIQWTR